MQRLEVSGAVRPIYGSLGVKRLTTFRKSLLPSSSVPTVREKCYLNQIHLHTVLTVIFNILIILKKNKVYCISHSKFFTASII